MFLLFDILLLHASSSALGYYAVAEESVYTCNETCCDGMIGYTGPTRVLAGKYDAPVRQLLSQGKV